MRREDRQQGYILLLIPVIVVALTVMGYQMANRSRTSLRVSASDLGNQAAQLCSRQCVSVAANRVQVALEGHRPVPAGSSDCRCGDGSGEKMGCATEIGAPAIQSVTACYGYEYKSTEVPITSRCEGERAGAAKLEETVAYGEIPIFQFAIFYDNFLLMDNSSLVEVKGLVHSNDTIAIGPGKSIKYHDWVTTPEVILASNGWANGTGDGVINRIHFALMDGSGAGGDPVRPSTQAYHPLRRAVPSWQDWKKRHRVAYGGEPNGCGPLKPLRIPIRNQESGLALLEPRKASDDESLRRQKFSWKSTLRFEGEWRDASSHPVAFPANPIVAPASPSGWNAAPVAGIPRVALFNGRDKLLVQLIPVDVARLQARSSSDSIVYLHDHLTDPSQGGRVAGGFLLHNGGRLVRPLTIATNTRLYLLGDYNTDSGYVVSGARYPFPSALIADNFTMLSNDFLPAEHAKGMYKGSPMIARNPAAKTTLNSCVMTGSAYIGKPIEDWGGHENLLRFEEDWNDALFVFSGSAVSLWSPAHTNSGWNRSGTPYYRPPHRKFSFSEMYRTLDHMPPGTPRLVAPSLVDWERARR